MPTETYNIVAGPSKARITDSFCSACSPAKVEASFDIKRPDGTKQTIVGIIVGLGYEDDSGSSFSFKARFKNYKKGTLVKGWYNTHKRTGFIEA